MKPILDVLCLSDSFSQLWEGLARSAGGRARIRERVTEVRTDSADSCGLVVAIAGDEDRALVVLHDLAPVGQRVAVVASEGDHRRVVALLKAGADDFFVLPQELSGLRAWITERVASAVTAREAQELVTEQRETYDFSRMIGESPQLRAALERAARVIPRTGATVLITGETGTGKELLARAIHFNGPRAAKPFVEINCAAIPANLLEAELFGYEAGAFTDARSAKPGLFEAADGGTLLLDEIGDLSPELQGKLLRVLESRRVRRLGSVRDQAVDVRVIAATHVDLLQASREGRFRSDLYYRLGVIPIHLPALRERGEDVLLLARHILDRLCEDYGTPSPTISPEVRRALLANPWPGNVRELKNALERALVLGDGSLRVDDLFMEPASTASAGGGRIPFPASMDEIQAAVARETLAACGGNKTEAARVLGISRRHLYVLLRRDEEVHDAVR